MKIGLIGGYGHECVKLWPDAELAWACDDFDDKALERAKAFGCGKTYPSMTALLDDFRPDVVYIGSVYGHNGCLAILAMERGFDVVSEKPLATDRQTLCQLHELTASGERRIIGEFAMRWQLVFAKAQELIRSGTIGEVAFIQAQKTYKFGPKRPDFYKSRELFGGIIPWVAVHAIDYAAWCTGLQYESVTAVQGNSCHPEYDEMEDHASMLFQMTGGVPCVITADFLRPEGASTHGDDRLRVTGSKGVIEIRNETLWIITTQAEESWTGDENEADGIQRAKDLVNAALGKSNPTISTAGCLHIAAAALAARDAADSQTGERVRLATLCASNPKKSQAV